MIEALAQRCRFIAPLGIMVVPLGIVSCSQNNLSENADRPIDGGFYILDAGEARWIGGEPVYQQLEAAEREQGFEGEIVVSIDGKEIGRFDRYGVSFWLYFRFPSALIRVIFGSGISTVVDWGLRLA